MQLLQSTVDWCLVVVLCSTAVMFSTCAAVDRNIPDATRGRREAGDNGFWKRSPGADSLNDSPASFWKRRSSHEHAPNSNAEFWKRSMHSPEFGSSFAWKSDDGMSSSPKSAAEFWKRFNGIDDNNVIEESLDKRFDETVGDFLSKQRRGDKSSQRRPEFNPTGW